MRMTRTTFVLMLAACSAPPPAATVDADAAATAPAPVTTAAPPANVEPAAAAATVTLAPDGLSIVDAPSGNTQLIAFGIPRASAELMIGNVQGAQINRGSSSECGAGTIDYTGYKDELQLAFQDGKFVGWTINGGESPLKTAKGIGIGSPRQSLDAAYPEVAVEDSSLGLLFSIGDLVGILDQDGIEGIVTDLWAGTVCLVD